MTAALLTASSWVLAQAPLGEPVALSNASFEDIPRQAQAPRGWYDCGFSGESAVDVQPASVLRDDTPPFFNVTHAAFDGNTYLGMVVRDNETYEAVGQRLREPLEAGKCYTFSVYLARAEQYVSQSRLKDMPVNYDTPAKLRIWGGSSYCNRQEIIAESAPVKNAEWLQYNFRFEPKSGHTYLLLEAYYKTPMLVPYNGNLLVDAAGKIVPVPCQDEEDIPERPLDDELLADVPEQTVTPPRPSSPKPPVAAPPRAKAPRAEARRRENRGAGPEPPERQRARAHARGPEPPTTARRERREHREALLQGRLERHQRGESTGAGRGVRLPRRPRRRRHRGGRTHQWPAPARIL